MLTCPSPLSQEQLGRLLSGEVAEAEQSELSSHIEECEPCRAALERLAAQSGLWDDLTLLRDDDDIDDIDADWSIPGLFEPPEEDGQIGILGPYAILETIGRGGMGVVFLAKDRTLDRLVAIKLMSPHLAASPSARRRFAREARAAAAVVHEHVVTIHAVDVSPKGIPYLVMQYVAGKSAQDLVDGFQTRRPAIEEILRIGSQVACGLAAAHEQGLIHRDVKPGNILLENGVERVKLTDFGLARAADDAAMTQTGLIAGTPQYMSPEQARGDALDPRTDLFSLGSVLYALATGLPPFRSRSSLATLKVVCEQEPEPIARLRPDLPPWFSTILRRLHAKEPDGRPASAAELAELLTRCLAHVRQPDRNPLPAELAPPRPSPRRRRLAAAIAIGALTLLAASPALPAVRDAAERFAILLRIKTPEGTLVVETDDPTIGITLDDSNLTVTGGVLRELKIPVGPHRIRATKDGKVFKEELVHIEKNGKSVLSVRREAEDAPTLAEAPKKLDLDALNRQGRISSKVEALAHLLMLNSLSVRSPSAHSNVYMKNLDTGRTRRIFEDFEDVHRITAVDWSADGSRIAFERAPREGEQARSFAVSVGDGKIDLKEVATGSWPSFSPDGERLATCLRGPVTPKEIIISGSRSSRERRIPTDGIPRWSPDGHRILLASNRGELGLACRILDADRERPIAFHPNRILSLPQWSGDQTIVALVETRSRGLEVAEFDISQPDSPREVYRYWSFADTPGFTPTWVLPSSKDRTVFILGKTADNKGRLLKVERKPNTLMTAVLPEPTPGALIHSACLSPDGNYLLYCEITQPTPPGAPQKPEATSTAPRPAPATDSSAKPAASPEERNAAIRKEVEKLVGAIRGEALMAIPDDRKFQSRVYIRDLREGWTFSAFKPFEDVRSITLADWSRDGSQIAFEVAPSPGSQATTFSARVRGGNVDIVPIAPGRVPLLVPAPALANSRSPFALKDANTPPSKEGVQIVGVDDTNERWIPGEGFPRRSPDGKRLLFIPPAGPKGFSCWLSDRETEVTEQIAFGETKIRSSPHWSGDRTIVAVVEIPSKGIQIQEFDVSQPREPRVVATLWPPKDQMGFTPTMVLPDLMNGGVVVLGTRETKSGDLLGRREKAGALLRIRRDVGGLTIENLTGPDTGVSPRNACLSPDGNYLLYPESTQPAAAPAPETRPEASVRPNATLEPAKAAEQLVEAMGRRPVKPTAPGANRMQIYLRDLQGGTTRLVLDEPEPGLTAVATPDWSRDGTRVAFWGAPRGDYTNCRVLVLGQEAGQARIQDLGPGGAPAWSPDGKRIAFRTDGRRGEPQAGTWVMNADGTDRVRLTSEGAPAWSPDGKFLLINSYEEETRSRIYSFETRQETWLTLPDSVIRSWPRWTAAGRLIAVLSRRDSGPALAEIDVTDPAHPVAERPLWKQEANDVGFPHWPTLLDNGDVLMVHIEGPEDRRLWLLKDRKLTPLDPVARPDQLCGLTVSPGGRYLMFNANRDDRK